MAESPSFQQVQAAMKAMIDKGMETPNEPIAMAVVDSAGNLLAYAAMDNLRVFSRRHCLRKAYTNGQGGLVIMKDGVILGGIGVGGYPSGQRDEDVSRSGLGAMGL